MRLWARTLAMVFVAFLTACTAPTKLEDLNSTKITLPDGTTIQAQTMFARVDLARGMMFRESLDKDRGMIFTHQLEGKYPAWMLNTKLPLDIIWLDRDHRVVEIAADAPPCPSKLSAECPTYGGKYLSQYVLELNAGSAKQHNITVGGTLGF